VLRSRERPEPVPPRQWKKHSCSRSEVTKLKSYAAKSAA
jgi:hypothetical protein